MTSGEDTERHAINLKLTDKNHLLKIKDVCSAITKNVSSTIQFLCTCLKYWPDVHFLQPFSNIVLIHQICATTRVAL